MYMYGAPYLMLLLADAWRMERTTVKPAEPLKSARRRRKVRRRSLVRSVRHDLE